MSLLERIPLEHRFTGLALVGVILCIAAGYTLRTFQAAKVIRWTKVVHVARSWGRADQTVPSSRINAQLPGLGVNACDFYASRKTLVCHP